MHLNEFEALVRLHQDRVFSFALHMLRSRPDAQDVTQDVLLRLWRRADTIEGDRVLPWLMRVTRNACIDALRHRKIVRNVVESDAEPDDLPYTSEATDGQLVNDEERSMVEDALDALSEPYRSIVILREIQGFTYEEICGAMDLPMSTVKVYLHRGRKRLRSALRDVMEREEI